MYNRLMITWHIDPSASDEAARAALGTDRLWNGYSIADIEPPYRAYTRVALAWHGDSAPGAACIAPDGQITSLRTCWLRSGRCSR